MLVTLSGIVKEVPICPAGYATKVVLSLLYNMLLSEMYAVLLVSTLITVRLVHPEKGLAPMLVTLSGMVTLVRLVHLEKAPAPMLVTLSGTVLQFSYACP
jgi:hypothetical protein